MLNKIKEIENQLLDSKLIRMPTHKNLPMKIKNDVFIHNAIITHKNKYNYSKVDYQGAWSKLIIICPDHGEFIQETSKHSRGAGCSKCFNDRNRITQSEFIEKAVKVHGILYNYSLVDYKLSRIKVKIKCKTHGVFEQTPNNHLRGKGCPNCPVDFNNSTAQLYILKNEMNQFKIGISIDIKRRINNLLNDNPFSEITQMISYDFFSFSKAREYESLVHNELKEYNIQFDEKFSGSTEWFDCTFDQATDAVNKFYKKYSLLEDIF